MTKTITSTESALCIVFVPKKDRDLQSLIHKKGELGDNTEFVPSTVHAQVYWMTWLHNNISETYLWKRILAGLKRLRKIEIRLSPGLIIVSSVSPAWLSNWKCALDISRSYGRVFDEMQVANCLDYLKNIALIRKKLDQQTDYVRWVFKLIYDAGITLYREMRNSLNVAYITLVLSFAQWDRGLETNDWR